MKSKSKTKSKTKSKRKPAKLKRKPDKGLKREQIAERNGQFLHDLAANIYTSKEYFKTGNNIMKIAEEIDRKIKRSGYKLLHPMSIEVNHYISDYAPYTEYRLRDEDIISFTIGTNGIKFGNPIPVRCAYTLSVKKESDYFYLIRAVSEACTAGMKECGPGVKLTEPSRAIEEVLNSYSDPVDGTVITDVKSLYNICGYNLENPEQMVPNLSKIPSHMENFCKGKMKEDQIYYIDVYGTNLTKNDVARNFSIPTMFKAPLFKNTKQVNMALNKLKVRYSKELYYFISQNYGSDIFSVRDVEKRCKNSWPKRYKFRPRQLTELSQHGIIKGIMAKFVDPDFNKKIKENMEKENMKRENTKKGKVATKTVSVKKDGRKAGGKDEENRTVTVHFGHSIYITDSGNKYLC
jgi:methionine aminopeptidase